MKKDRRRSFRVVDMRTGEVLAKIQKTKWNYVVPDTTKLKLGGVYWLKDTQGELVPIQIGVTKERMLHMIAYPSVAAEGPFEPGKAGSWNLYWREINVLDACELLEEFEKDQSNVENRMVKNEEFPWPPF